MKLLIKQFSIDLAYIPYFIMKSPGKWPCLYVYTCVSTPSPPLQLTDMFFLGNYTWNMDIISLDSVPPLYFSIL